MATYKIQQGDTLSGIALNNNTSVNALMKANSQIKNPNLIYAGNTLNLPSIVSTKPTSPVVTIPVKSVVKNTPLNVVTTTPITTTPVTTTTTPPVTLTPEQTQASNLSKKIQDLNTSLSGETQYQTQQNQLAGVDQVQQAVNDNNLAIERLNNSANQAKLTAENRLAPMFQIGGEQAQINRQRSFQMLGLASISDALRNNLVSATQKANEAVQLKYGTIENQIKADTANLNLVLHSPEATLNERKQANQMLQDNRVKANDMLVQRQNQENIFKVMTLSAQNKDNFTPTTEYPTLSMAMQAITNAKTPQDALVIASNTGLTASAKKSGSFSLSAGQTRYDAQGNVIASSAPRVSTTATTKTNTALVTSGFTSQQATHLLQGVAQDGLQSVYDAEKKAGATSQQLSSLAGAYGMVTKDRIASTVDADASAGKLDVGSILQEKYTNEELKNLAYKAGFTSGMLNFIGLGGGDIKSFIASKAGIDLAKQIYTNILYEQYKQAGKAI